MTPAKIKNKRTESLLVELIPEALASLNDKRLHEIVVVDVQCSRGRSDAKVFLDAQSYTEKEKNTYLRLLRGAMTGIEAYIMQDQGWYRCPIMTFEYDTHFAQVAKMDSLFKQISKKPEETEDKEDKDES